MARIKLTLPEKPVFETKMKVRISDLNYGGHLGNDAVLSLIHESRVRFLAILGGSELNIAEGVSIIMADSAIVYQAEGFFGDEIMIRVFVDDFSRVGFDLYYELVKQDGKKLATAKTGIVCFNYEARKVQEVPKSFIEKCEKLLA